MAQWPSTIRIGTEDLKLLVSSPQGDDLIKARLPIRPPHSRRATHAAASRKLRPDASYGVEEPLRIGARTSRWIGLCGPDPSPEYAEAHARWRERR